MFYKKCLFLLLLLVVMTLVGCQGHSAKIFTIQADSVVIDSTLDAIQDSDYLQHLAPTTELLNRELDVVIGYAPRAMKAEVPESELLNWACDALYDMAMDVYSGQVDFSVVNVGGIRCAWNQGDITRRHVFELMPFDNSLVILTLTGDKVIELCECFAKQGGQGVSRHLRLTMHEIHPKYYRVSSEDILLNGKPIDRDAVYYVATSDYLSTGADLLTPLSQYLERYSTNLLIRDLYMDYILKNKIVEASVDERMKIIK